MTKRIAKKKAAKFAKLIEKRHRYVILARNSNESKMIRYYTDSGKIYKSILKLIRSTYWTWVSLYAEHLRKHCEIYGKLPYGKWFPKDFTMSWAKNSEQDFVLDTMYYLGHSEEEIQAVADSMGW